jgi:hypothetical protein
LRKRPDLLYQSAPGKHIDYEKWHRDMDEKMVEFIDKKEDDLLNMFEFIQKGL